MSRPILLPTVDRISFGLSSPTIQEQLILAPASNGSALYIGTSSLITVNPNSTISTINTDKALFTFDILNQQTTAQGRFIASSFQGNGALLSNLQFTNILGTIQPTQFSFNTIPLLALSQFGNITIAGGSISVVGTISATTGTYSQLNATSLNVSNLTIPGNLTFSNATVNTLQATSINGIQAVLTSAFINNATIFNFSNDTFQTRILFATTVSTTNLSLNNFTANTVNIVDQITAQILPLTSAVNKLTFNGNSLLDSSDLFILDRNITQISNDFTSYSNASLSSFTTGVLSSPLATISSLFTTDVRGRDIYGRNLQISTFVLSSLTTNAVNAGFLSAGTSVVNFQAINTLSANTISTSRLTVNSISSVFLNASNAFLCNVSVGAIFASSIGGTFGDAFAVGVQQYTQNLQPILSNTTTVELSVSTVSIPLPITTERVGRILILKDSRGALSPATPVILYTLGFDTIDGFGFSMTLSDPYSFLILQASPNSRWMILATNQFLSLQTANIKLSNITMTSGTQGSFTDPILTQISVNGLTSYPVGQRIPLRTSTIVATSSIQTTVNDMSTYYFLRNNSRSAAHTLFLPASNTLPNGWTITVNYDQRSSNYMFIRDVNSGAYNFILTNGLTRQIVYSGGVFYSLGGAAPFGLF